MGLDAQRTARGGGKPSAMNGLSYIPMATSYHPLHATCHGAIEFFDTYLNSRQ